MNKIIKYLGLLLIGIILPISQVLACAGEDTLLPRFGYEHVFGLGIMSTILILLFIIGIIILIFFKKKKFSFYSLLVIFDLLPICFWLPYIFSNNGKGWLIVVIISNLLFVAIFDYILFLNKKKNQLSIYLLLIYIALFIAMWSFYDSMRPTFCIGVSDEYNDIPYIPAQLN